MAEKLFGSDGKGPDESQTVAIGMVRCKVCDGPIYYDPLKPPPAPENAICDQGPNYCKRWAKDYPLALWRAGFPKAD
jgi:hypothetical protein